MSPEEKRSLKSLLRYEGAATVAAWLAIHFVLDSIQDQAGWNVPALVIAVVAFGASTFLRRKIFDRVEAL